VQATATAIRTTDLKAGDVVREDLRGASRTVCLEHVVPRYIERDGAQTRVYTVSGRIQATGQPVAWTALPYRIWHYQQG